MTPDPINYRLKYYQLMPIIGSDLACLASTPPCRACRCCCCNGDNHGINHQGPVHVRSLGIRSDSSVSAALYTPSMDWLAH